MKSNEQELLPDVQELGADVLASQRFQDAWKIPHHGNVSVAMHSLHVAKESLRLARWLNRHGGHVNEKDAVCSSLLHDIGMTERVIHKSMPWVKAYTHPTRGSTLAEEEYHVNAVQADAIKRHMWPICVIPPRHLTGWVVTAADKISSMKEVLGNLKTTPVLQEKDGVGKHDGIL